MTNITDEKALEYISPFRNSEKFYVFSKKQGCYMGMSTDNQDEEFMLELLKSVKETLEENFPNLCARVDIPKCNGCDEYAVFDSGVEIEKDPEFRWICTHCEEGEL